MIAGDGRDGAEIQRGSDPRSIWVKNVKGKSSKDAALAAVVVRVLEEPCDGTIGVEDIPPSTYMKVLKRNSRR